MLTIGIRGLKTGSRRYEENNQKVPHTKCKGMGEKISRHDKQTCIDRNGYIDPISGKWECEYNQALDCVFPYWELN